MDSVSIVIIGAGNIATHLAPALDNTHNIIQLYSRHIDNAYSIAKRLRNCGYTDDLSSLNPNADIYIISVSDDAIEEVSSHMPKVRGIVAHTSGSVGIDVLSINHRRCGVFYPLQTFSKEANLDVSKVPFFIEGSDSESCISLMNLANSISQKTYFANSSQRQSLHLAAVFACNFFNHMLVVSSRILDAEGYDISVLRPLLNVTLDKAMEISPLCAQTGPASRHDKNTMRKHLDRLAGFDKDIYSLVSKAIMAEIYTHEIGAQSSVVSSPKITD